LKDHTMTNITTPGEARANVAWGPDPIFSIDAAVPQVPIDPGQFLKIMALPRQHLVRRLLLAVHYLCCRAGRLEFTVGEQELSRLAWAGHRPHHWRSFLKTAVSRAVIASIPLSQGSAVTITYENSSHSYGVLVPPSFLGSLKILVGQNKGLTLLKRNPDPDRKISKKQLAYLRDHGWNTDGEGKTYRDGELREFVRDRCVKAASVPTLAAIARARKSNGGYRTIFIPALLGDEHVCRELEPLVNLLADNHTRWRSGVTEAKIAAATGTERVTCPLLDPSQTYAAFAGNQGGRGYRLKKWAELARTNEPTFLKRLTAAKERLVLQLRIA
jgi:hypothetical protein